MSEGRAGGMGKEEVRGGGGGEMKRFTESPFSVCGRPQACCPLHQPDCICTSH